MTEIQVFANGHLPILEMTSDLIDLGSSKTLTTIDWEADIPSGTAVEVRTRTGNDLREVNRYFKKDGTEVANKEEYEKQPSFYQGDILTEFLPRTGLEQLESSLCQTGRSHTFPQSPALYDDPGETTQ